MKTRTLVLTLLALALIFAAPAPETALARDHSDQYYAAKQLSPKAGAVVKSGDVVRIEWESAFPNVDLSMCETELLISLDHGNTYTYISSQRNPKIRYFNWTVPQVPAGAPVLAILDIRFGCLNVFPETYSPQIEYSFLIRAE